MPMPPELDGAVTIERVWKYATGDKGRRVWFGLKEPEGRIHPVTLSTGALAAAITELQAIHALAVSHQTVGSDRPVLPLEVDSAQLIDDRANSGNLLLQLSTPGSAIYQIALGPSFARGLGEALQAAGLLGSYPKADGTQGQQ